MGIHRLGISDIHWVDKSPNHVSACYLYHVSASNQNQLINQLININQ